jgi:hypothetical protein
MRNIRSLAIPARPSRKPEDVAGACRCRTVGAYSISWLRAGCFIGQLQSGVQMFLSIALMAASVADFSLFQYSVI